MTVLFGYVMVEPLQGQPAEHGEVVQGYTAVPGTRAITEVMFGVAYIGGLGGTGLGGGEGGDGGSGFGGYGDGGTGEGGGGSGGRGGDGG